MRIPISALALSQLCHLGVTHPQVVCSYCQASSDIWISRLFITHIHLTCKGHQQMVQKRCC